MFEINEIVYSTAKNHDGFGKITDIYWYKGQPRYTVLNDITETEHYADEQELRKVKVKHISNMGDQDTHAYDCPEQTNYLPRARQRPFPSKTQYLTTQQVAEKRGVNSSTVRRWCMSGKIAAHKVGRAWLIEETE